MKTLNLILECKEYFNHIDMRRITKLKDIQVNSPNKTKAAFIMYTTEGEAEDFEGDLKI